MQSHGDQNVELSQQKWTQFHKANQFNQHIYFSGQPHTQTNGHIPLLLLLHWDLFVTQETFADRGYPLPTPPWLFMSAPPDPRHSPEQSMEGAIHRHSCEKRIVTLH